MGRSSFYYQSDKDEIDKQLGWLISAYQAAQATGNYALRETILEWIKAQLAPKKRR